MISAGNTGSEVAVGTQAAPLMDLDSRIRLAERVRAARDDAARRITEEFLDRHPDWRARYGERARTRGIEDAGFHLDFLAGAVESGSPAAFAEYARWAGGVLSARGIDASFVAENLLQLGPALAPFLTPAQRPLVEEYLRLGAESLPGTDGAEPGPSREGPLAVSRRLFLRAILRGERRAAAGIAMEALRAGHAVADVYADVLQEAQREVGRLWERNRITVAKEHMATAVTMSVMARLYEQIPLAARSLGAAVVTGVEGELHQVGAHMVADVLEADGWSVRFLGANVPHAGILEAVTEQRADLVGISATMIFNLRQVRRLIAGIRGADTGRPPHILVGGSAFRAAPEAWREVGADAFAPDLRAAVRAARSLRPATAAAGGE